MEKRELDKQTMTVTTSECRKHETYAQYEKYNPKKTRWTCHWCFDTNDNDTKSF